MTTQSRTTPSWPLLPINAPNPFCSFTHLPRQLSCFDRTLLSCFEILTTAREISLAELARRGIEHILNVYSSAAVSADLWHLPKPRDLGWKGLTHAQVKEEAQLTAAELRHGGKPKRH